MSGTYQVKFKLSTLTVPDAQEESWYSNGDEPYFVFFGIRSRFLTPGSTQVSWSGYLDDHWAQGVRDRASRPIPPSMGEVTFEKVQIKSIADLRQGNLPEVIGVVGVAMESDATSFSTIRSMMGSVQNAITVELRRLVEQFQINLSDPAADIQQAIANIRTALTPSTRQSIKAFISSFGDFDDLIGAQACFYLAGDQSIQNVVSGVEMLTNRNLMLDFLGDGAHYQAWGILWMTLVTATTVKSSG